MFQIHKGKFACHVEYNFLTQNKRYKKKQKVPVVEPNLAVTETGQMRSWISSWHNTLMLQGTDSDLCTIRRQTVDMYLNIHNTIIVLC